MKIWMIIHQDCMFSRKISMSCIKTSSLLFLYQKCKNISRNNGCDVLFRKIPRVLAYDFLRFERFQRNIFYFIKV